MDSFVINRSAAAIAGVALCELFPGIKLLGACSTSVTFSCDFQSMIPLASESEILIEEQMRQIVREGRSIRVLEMVPSCARALFAKEGQSFLIQKVDEASLVRIVQIGAVHDLGLNGPYLKNSALLAVFKLHPLRQIAAKTFRLSGCAFSSKSELRDFLKLYKSYPQKNHMWIGEKNALWVLWNGQVVWLSAGLKWLRGVMDELRTHLFLGTEEVRFSVVQPRSVLHSAFAAKYGSQFLELSEIYFEPLPPLDPEIGFFSGKGGGRILITAFGLSENRQGKLISSLQRIEKTLNILGFRPTLRLFGKKRSDKKVQIFFKALECLEKDAALESEEMSVPRLEFLVRDQLGRQWTAFSTELTVKGFIVTASVERLVALLLERTFVELKTKR